MLPVSQQIFKIISSFSLTKTVKVVTVKKVSKNSKTVVVQMST